MPDGDDFAASLMNDIDPRLLELIHTRINSFIKWDLVRFFHDNPHTADTADSIARYTGRDVHRGAGTAPTGARRRWKSKNWLACGSHAGRGPRHAQSDRVVHPRVRRPPVSRQSDLPCDPQPALKGPASWSHNEFTGSRAWTRCCTAASSRRRPTWSKARPAPARPRSACSSSSMASRRGRAGHHPHLRSIPRALLSRCECVRLGFPAHEARTACA